MKRERSPGSEIVLLEDVIMEILSWLPVKSLVQFRSVCKYWKYLISHPHFIKLHLHRSHKTDNLIILTLKNSFPNWNSLHVIHPISYFLHNPSSINAAAQDHCLQSNGNDDYTVLGSCNGLVCLLHRYASAGYEEYSVQFWNPTMRLISKKSTSLSVEGFTGSTKFGFGYGKSSDTYKVVAVLNGLSVVEDSKRPRVKVYTMGDDAHCWRDIQTFPAFPFKGRNEGRFMSGTLNWLAIQNFATWPLAIQNFATGPIKTINWDITVDQFAIVSLDLGTETYKQISLPPIGLDEIPDSRNFEPMIEVFGDCLCLFYDYNRTHFIMWQMKEFGVEKSWTKFVKVSYQHLQNRRLNCQWCLIPLCISGNGNVLMMQKNGCQVILYNRRDNRVEGAAEISKQGIYIYNAKNYVQSLILPC